MLSQSGQIFAFLPDRQGLDLFADGGQVLLSGQVPEHTYVSFSLKDE